MERRSAGCASRTAVSMVLVVWMLGVASVAGAQTLTFARDDYPSYAGARAIATADFNRDGWPDVAHANTGRNTVTILLNQGGSGLKRAADVAVGAGPFDVTTGDYNRDGIADLAVANADGNSISILIGKGDGSFTRSDLAAAAQNPRGIATADVNNDGKPDLIYSGYATGVVQVLIGNGSGGFTKGVTYTSSALYPQGLATGDFNHDGHLDVAVAYASSTGLRILYGNGGTAFAARTVTGDTYLNVVAAGDFDRDGWDDLAAASTTRSTVGIYRGTASGFVHTATYVVGSSPRGIAAADLNDDGALDLVTANRASSTVSILRGDRAHPGAFLSHIDVAAASGSRAVAIDDFDADGRLDIVTGNEYAASATVLSNRTYFTRAAYDFKYVAVPQPSDVDLAHVLAADFNRDGRLDLAAQGPLSIDVLLTGGSAVHLAIGHMSTFAVGDFNADGNADLLYAILYASATIGTYLGDGRGGFVAAPTSFAADVKSVAIGDLNRDGRPDLVCVSFDRAAGGYVLQVALGKGDGTFAAPTVSLPLPEYAPDIAVADVNRDGKLDVVAMVSGYERQQPSEARVWFGTGNGGLTASSWSASFASQYGQRLGVADVNHDGYVDIVASEYQLLAVALGSAAGFSATAFTSVTTDGRFLGAVSIGDLDIDGNVDVALGTGDVMFGRGDGTFVPGGRFDYGADRVSIADFTGDGLPDIIGGRVLANTRNVVNHPPTVNAGPDQTIDWPATQGEDCNFSITAAASDPDAHWLTYEWRRDAQLVSTDATVYLCGPPPGSYSYSVTVRDGRGGVASDSVTVTILPVKEIVLWAADAGTAGRWTLVSDATAAGGLRAYDPNLAAPKVTVPLAQPASLVAFRFYADPTQTYKLWIRLKADKNSWTNDSVWVQFSGATDLAGTPKYGIGTTSGLSVSLEECSGCGVSGWGWEDDGWGAVNTLGVLLRFPQNPDEDPQMLQIQTREDGVSIDQIVLSAEKYLTTRPGAAKNDTTILPKTQP